MKRIYHNHEKWEEVKYGMYDSVNLKRKNYQIQQVIFFFESEELVKKYMAFVVDNFKFSCEHNFTNPSMNKIAFLGQSAVSVWKKIPAEITKEAWNLLRPEIQERANKIAEKEIMRWEKCQKNI